MEKPLANGKIAICSFAFLIIDQGKIAAVE
jgi:hypothetical protein